MLLGGPPCQSYSMIGRSRNAGNHRYNADDDDRLLLYEQYVQVLDRLRPAVAVMENVKGMLSVRRNGKRIFPVIMNSLRHAGGMDGYRLFALDSRSEACSRDEGLTPSDFLVQAEEHGVPQSRHRVFVICVRRDIAKTLPDEYLPRLEGGDRMVSVKDVIGAMPKLRSRLSQGDDPGAWQSAVRAACDLVDENQPLMSRDEEKRFRGALERTRAMADGYAPPWRDARGKVDLPKRCPPELRDWLFDEKIERLPNNETRAHMAADFGRYLYAAAFAQAFRRTPKRRDFPAVLAPNHANWDTGYFDDRYRVQVANRPCTTVTSHIAKDGHYFIHPDPSQCRSLTVREVARLQTFPDNYFFHGSRTHQYVQGGQCRPTLSRVSDRPGPVEGAGSSRPHGKALAPSCVDGFQPQTCHPGAAPAPCRHEDGMTPRGAAPEQEVPPRASVLVESLRDIGYSLQTAVADVIDNSLTARGSQDRAARRHACGNAWRSVSWTTASAWRKRSSWKRCAREAGVPLKVGLPPTLGRFGLGLKTASFSQCRRLTVVTRRRGEWSCAVWDLDTVAARDRWIVERPSGPAGIPWTERLVADGTLVVWEKLDRLVGPDGGGDRQDLVRQLDESATHLEFVFHRFLSGREGREGPVKMYLNGRELRPFDPFHSQHPATQHHPEERFQLDGREIRIRPVTLPHHDKVSEADWKRYAGPQGYVKNHGVLSVSEPAAHRSRHVVSTRASDGAHEIVACAHRHPEQSGCWSGKLMSRRLGRSHRPRFARDFVESSSASACRPGARTWRRGARLTNDSRLPVWTRSQDKNRISYELNLEHPLFSAFETRLDEETAEEFRRLVALVVSTLPVEALYADVSASSESVVRQVLDKQDFEEIVEATWGLLRGSGRSSGDTEARMRSAEPFGSRWAEAAEVIRTLEAGGREAL